MNNILSIDFESWIHFYKDILNDKNVAMTSSERKLLDDDWVLEVLDKILNLLDQYDQTATFFMVGEIYEWHPEITQKIITKGHEVGYHTHSHLRLNNASVLQNELLKSKKFIENVKPIGFRAPSIFMQKDAMTFLKQSGFRYSSSTYANHKIHQIDGVDEIPVTTISYRKNNKEKGKFVMPAELTLKMLFTKIPFGSGLFVSFFGRYMTYVIKWLNKKKGVPAILFIHPWQLYQPGEIKGFKFKLRVFYHNPLGIFYTKNISKGFRKILSENSFISFERFYYD